MKKYSLLLSLMLLCTLLLSAQIPYPTQPSKGYYEDLKALVLPMVPTDSALMNIKPSAIPVSFKDTLLKYDWYEIAGYGFFDKTYTSNFSKDLTERENKYGNNEFKFRRYTENGTVYMMNLDRHKDSSIRVTTTTFDEKTATKLIEVKQVSSKNMMVTENYGETEMQEIISYDKGVLVMCIKEAPNSTNKKYHMAYIAVPKTF